MSIECEHLVCAVSIVSIVRSVSRVGSRADYGNDFGMMKCG